MKNNRVHYIDIAKCILIICVIITHAEAFSRNAGINHLKWINDVRYFFNPFFMPAFFLITGLVSSFGKRTFFDEVFYNFKILMIPNFSLSVGIPISSYILRGGDYEVYLNVILDFCKTGGFWFLISLFFNKILFGILVRKFTNSIILLISLVCLFIGVILSNNNFTNILYYQNALILLPYLSIGYLLRDKINRYLNKYILLVAILISYSAVISICFITQYSLPVISQNVSIKTIEIPLFLLMATLGSFSCLIVSALIKFNKYMEYIGRETLVIYIFHMYFLIKIIQNIPTDCNINGYILGIGIIFVCLILCTISNILIVHTPLKIILGKF